MRADDPIESHLIEWRSDELFDSPLWDALTSLLWHVNHVVNQITIEFCKDLKFPLKHRVALDEHLLECLTSVWQKTASKIRDFIDNSSPELNVSHWHIKHIG